METVGRSPEVEDFIDEAQERIDDFTEHHREDPVPGFVSCEFFAVYTALKAIVDEELAPGSNFCEWGMGFGVVSCLSSMLGFKAYGIEIEDTLVEEARNLASHFGLEVEIASGNFIPREGEDIADRFSETEWLTMGGRDGHEELGLDPEEFDLLFAFPWPGEEEVILRLFDRFGSVGALLLLYQGVEGIHLYRKVG
jgi:hypothetical protein